MPNPLMEEYRSPGVRVRQAGALDFWGGGVDGGGMGYEAQGPTYNPVGGLDRPGSFGEPRKGKTAEPGAPPTGPAPDRRLLWLGLGVAAVVAYLLLT